ncbi:hypothetical protein BCR35DRAFT_157076 [Leucosporidium creatinivorum]|uniref:Uncharacterized protein n=1 Tax=Leucosporidium creatinivorum TaxID=106004 RepID=A0A1Y2G1M0_9BASI|nr:hypothetical protein BCR35DRAFT_157076 [Leucosporidium creatinivorum]
MAPPSLSDDVVACILAALSEKVEDSYIEPPYGTLLACTLVSKAWHPLAIHQLYAHLEVELCLHIAVEPLSDSLSLERTLLMRPALGAHTRTLRMKAKPSSTEPADRRKGEAAVIRVAGVFLYCCPNLLGIDFFAFNTDFGAMVQCSLLELIEALRPGLTRLALNDVHLDQANFLALVPRFANLQHFTLMSKLWDDRQLDLEPSHPLFALLKSLSTNLTSLELHLDLSPPRLRAAFSLVSQFYNLRHLRLHLGKSPEVAADLVAALHRLNHLATFTCTFTHTGPEFSFATLPFSLRRIDFPYGLPFVAILELVLQPERENCLILWSEEDWGSMERKMMERFVAAGDVLRRRYPLDE